MAALNRAPVGSNRASWMNGGSIVEQELPRGACNFREPGTNSSSTCGCQRFWLNTVTPNGHGSAHPGYWCYCGHNICYHAENAQQERESNLSRSSMMQGVLHYDQQHDVPRTPSFQRAPAGYVPAQQAQIASTKPTGLGIRPERDSHSQSINTRVWAALNNFARDQERDNISGAVSLPSTAQSMMMEYNGSTTYGSTHGQPSQNRQMGPPIIIPGLDQPRESTENYSATELATPSIRGTPDLRAALGFSNVAKNSPKTSPAEKHSAQTPGRVESQQPVAKSPQALRLTSQDTVAGAEMPPPLEIPDREIWHIVKCYGHRLDVLENLSFSHVPADEIQERFEQVDGRLLDLEQWRTDHEQTHASAEDVSFDNENAHMRKGRRALPQELSFSGSDGSFDINAAAHAEASLLATLATDAESRPRIEALERSVADLQNASLPSLTRPWQIQVVLLPWGRDLRGIWFSAAESTQRSLKSTPQPYEEWSGAQSSQASSFRSPQSGTWTTESIEAWADETKEWLSPKACGPSGMVFQRLLSRGLVQDVTLTRSDAYHVQNAIIGTFGDVLQASLDADREVKQRYQALNERFIPLRKVRKSSRLRFLTPAEMVTSANWSAQFLESSVLMNVGDGLRRLYVTTPSAYIQPNEPGYSWPLVKQLPLFDAAESEEALRAAKAAIESCWTYNNLLDRPASTYSSFVSHASGWSPMPQPSEDGAQLPELRPSSSSSQARPARQRTVSLPDSTITVQMKNAAAPKRRVASFESAAHHHRRHPSHESAAAADLTAKRRRISLSPQAVRLGIHHLTPRWSREPPSPFTSEPAVPGEARGSSSQGGTSSRQRRGTTPFAYATPHSNTHFAGAADLLLTDGGDTERDTDSEEEEERGGGEEGFEEEWEGVVDDDDGMEDPSRLRFEGGESEVGDFEMDGAEEEELEVGYSADGV